MTIREAIESACPTHSNGCIGLVLSNSLAIDFLGTLPSLVTRTPVNCALRIGTNIQHMLPITNPAAMMIIGMSAASSNPKILNNNRTPEIIVITIRDMKSSSLATLIPNTIPVPPITRITIEIRTKIAPKLVPVPRLDSAEFSIRPPIIAINPIPITSTIHTQNAIPATFGTADISLKSVVIIASLG